MTLRLCSLTVNAGLCTATFDTSRTFNGTVFKLHEHIDACTSL